jgi:hypothetical protein
MKTSINQVAAFGKLVGFCNAHGPMYNPSKASIQAAALDSLLTSAQETLQAVTATRTAYENAIMARVQAFDALRGTSSRAIAALRASGVSAETLVYARSIKRSFASRRKKSTATPLPASSPAPAGISGEAGEKDIRHNPVTQLSYESKASNFARLVERIASESLYKPNEDDLKISTLQAFAARLRDSNTAVTNTSIAMSNARIARNKVLFKSPGVHSTAMEVKDYIKSVFGNGSEQYKQVSQIRFKTL